MTPISVTSKLDFFLRGGRPLPLRLVPPSTAIATELLQHEFTTRLELVLLQLVRSSRRLHHVPTQLRRLPQLPDLTPAPALAPTPARCLELGTYCGYSALRIARNLPEHGNLVSVEVDPLFGAIATKIIEHAGLEHKVKVVTGTVEDKVDRITRSLYGSDDNKKNLCFVLFDHSKERFVPDLELLEKAWLAGPGTVVMGDTTAYPGEEGSTEGTNLLSYFVSSSKYRVQQHVGTEKAAGITVSEMQYMV